MKIGSYVLGEFGYLLTEDDGSGEYEVLDGIAIFDLVHKVRVVDSLTLTPLTLNRPPTFIGYLIDVIELFARF